MDIELDNKIKVHVHRKASINTAEEGVSGSTFVGSRNILFLAVKEVISRDAVYLCYNAACRNLMVLTGCYYSFSKLIGIYGLESYPHTLIFPYFPVGIPGMPVSQPCHDAIFLFSLVIVSISSGP